RQYPHGRPTFQRQDDSSRQHPLRPPPRESPARFPVRAARWLPPRFVQELPTVSPDPGGVPKTLSSSHGCLLNSTVKLHTSACAVKPQHSYCSRGCIQPAASFRSSVSDRHSRTSTNGHSNN